MMFLIFHVYPLTAIYMTDYIFQFYHINKLIFKALIYIIILNHGLTTKNALRNCINFQ